MPRPRIAMRKIREVLRLTLGEELSRRQVSAASGVPLTTVNDYLRRAAAGLKWPLPGYVDDAALEHMLYSQPASPAAGRPLPDWRRVHTELRRKQVTLQRARPGALNKGGDATVYSVDAPGGQLPGRRVLHRLHQPPPSFPGVCREPDRIRRARAWYPQARHPGQHHDHGPPALRKVCGTGRGRKTKLRGPASNASPLQRTVTVPCRMQQPSSSCSWTCSGGRRRSATPSPSLRPRRCRWSPTPHRARRPDREFPAAGRLS
jgi:hypothetical protein